MNIGEATDTATVLDYIARLVRDGEDLPDNVAGATGRLADRASKPLLMRIDPPALASPAVTSGA